MKKLFTTIILVSLVMVGFSQSGESSIPSIDIKTTNGKTVNSSTFSNDGKPMVISFWATWCKPCVRELSNIAEVYETWVDETGVKLIAISIDDARSMSRVAPFTNGKGWDYEIYIDTNSDLKRAMNVPNVPHTFLIDGEGKIVYQHTSYSDGDEKQLYEKIKKLVE
ncbi:MAG: TlpA family protein disulfide reductase [Salinivirgaceae bacterium]|nr:TlpA family protein disulfide reductase [Salinivirgaceae bacterium]